MYCLKKLELGRKCIVWGPARGVKGPARGVKGPARGVKGPARPV